MFNIFLDLKQFSNQSNKPLLLSKTLIMNLLIPGSPCYAEGVLCGGGSICISSTCTCPPNMPNFDLQNLKCSITTTTFQYKS